MKFDPMRALDVLVVCVPVFGMMGLGKLLELRGKLDSDRRRFINWLVYYFSLPALVFAEVSQQRITSFLNPALTLWPITAVVLVAVFTMGVAKLLRYRGAFAAAFVFCTFWANVTYMGFPLCTNAFGMEGLAKAAIYNTFMLPVLIVLGYSLIGFYGAGHSMTLRSKLQLALFNPVVIAVLLGIGVSLVAERFRGANGILMAPTAVQGVLALLGSFLRLLGSMGLPMALLAIGASIHWQQTRKHLGALAYTVTAKLVLLPLITFLGVRLFFPETDPVVVGVVAMLGATPNSIASYVVSCQMGVEEEFVSSSLVVTTVLSTLTLPLWLYAVL